MLKDLDCLQSLVSAFSSLSLWHNSMRVLFIKSVQSKERLKRLSQVLIRVSPVLQIKYSVKELDNQVSELILLLSWPLFTSSHNVSRMCLLQQRLGIKIISTYINFYSRTRLIDYSHNCLLKTQHDECDVMCLLPTVIRDKGLPYT